MSTVIKLKYSNTTAQPADGLLQLAEPAYSYVTDKLWFGYDNSGTIIPKAVGGVWYTDQLAASASDKGVLAASKAIVVDADKKIDEFYVDLLKFDGTTISTNNGGTDTDLTLQADGNGSIVFNSPISINAGSNLQVGDLTATRVVFVGSSQELTDNANFTFNSSTGALSVNGSLNVDDLNLDGSTISATGVNTSITVAPTGTGRVILNTNTALVVPKGVVGTRPTAANAGDGAIRYNETSGRFEGVVSGSWTGLGGVIDIDQDTYIDAEETSDEDKLRFYTAGTERAVLEANGFSTSVTAYFPKIEVDGTAPGSGVMTLDNDTITINGSTIQGTGNSGLGTIVLDPAPAAGDNGGDLIVRGNLQVTGTTTTVNSTVVEIADPVMVLGEDTAVDSLDRGISLKYNDGAAKEAFFGWDRGTSDTFTFVVDGSTADSTFNNLNLKGSITNYDNATPTNGQILIGTGTDLILNTITDGDAINIVNSTGDIEIDVLPASAVATVDPYAEDISAQNIEVDVQYTIISVGTTTDWNDLANTTGVTYIDGDTFTASRDGTAGDGDGEVRSFGTNYNADSSAPTISVANVTVGESYKIVVPGDTDFTAIGSADNNAGTTFTASAKGTGTGTVQATAAAAQFAAYRGAASFASEQFTVTNGHVVITEIDGGTF